METPGRCKGLDLLRGAAVLLMLVDHICAVWFPTSPWRLLTRLSMPAFFVIAGHLARANWRRLLVVAAWGLVLPAMVPWIDAPNVLLLYAVGVPLVVLSDRLPDRGLTLVALCLTASANGWVRPVGHYDPLCVLSLMIVGRLLPLPQLLERWRGPQLLVVVGRHSLPWYVGHLLALVLIQRLT